MKPLTVITALVFASLPLWLSGTAASGTAARRQPIRLSDLTLDRAFTTVIDVTFPAPFVCQMPNDLGAAIMAITAPENTGARLSVYVDGLRVAWLHGREGAMAPYQYVYPGPLIVRPGQLLVLSYDDAAGGPYYSFPRVTISGWFLHPGES